MLRMEAISEVGSQRVSAVGMVGFSFQVFVAVVRGRP